MADEEEKKIDEELVSKNEETEEKNKVEAETVLPDIKENTGTVRVKNERRKNERKPSRRPERARQEFDNKIINVRRVARVVAGGRRFSFSIAVVIGDKNGKVGVGIGKAGDTPIAIDKAIKNAKKNSVKVLLTDKKSIAHPVEAKYSSARVFISPAPGKGVVAGSAVRIVLELAGIREVSAKILSRSKDKLNIAKATIKALGRLKSYKGALNK